MTPIQEEYFNLRYRNKMKKLQECYFLSKNITNKKERDVFIKSEIKRINNETDIKKEYIKKELSIKTDLKTLKKYFKDYHKLYNKYYNNSRIELFLDPIKLLHWYKAQNNKCGYCGISTDELEKIAIKRSKEQGLVQKKNLTLNGGKKRSQGTLEIERLNSSTNDYCFSNIILACPLCNNAKSNLIDENGWRKYFVSSMRKYYESILERPLKYSIPAS